MRFLDGDAAWGSVCLAWLNRGFGPRLPSVDRLLRVASAGRYDQLPGLDRVVGGLAESGAGPRVTGANRPLH